jgi:Zn-finger nucleic acid-binding protein
MERGPLGAVSDIVVDVCPAHGAWFQQGELHAALVWAANPEVRPQQHLWIDERREVKLAPRPLTEHEWRNLHGSKGTLAVLGGIGLLWFAARLLHC